MPAPPLVRERRPGPRGRGTDEHGRRPVRADEPWLRGRIVARLRALDDDAWAELPARIGVHGKDAIEAAAGALQADGLIERRPDGAVRLPSGPT